MRFGSERWRFDCIPMSAWPDLAAEGTDPARSHHTALALITDDHQPAPADQDLPTLWVREDDLDFHDLLDRLRATEPDVVVLRIGSPADLDHLRAIRHLLTRTGIVALVDEADDESLLQLLSLGADEVLPTELGDPLSIGRSACFAMVRRSRVAELHQAAAIDSLTGVLDERGLWSLGARTLEVVQATGLPVTGVYADIDGLTFTNAEFGEELGDTVLCRVTWLLRETIPGIELMARAGDDEFFVVTTAPPGQLPSEPRLTCSLDHLHPEVEVSVTLGMISSPAGIHAGLPSLVRSARADMHRVKGRVDGRARWDSPADAWRRND